MVGRVPMRTRIATWTKLISIGLLPIVWYYYFFAIYWTESISRKYGAALVASVKAFWKNRQSEELRIGWYLMPWILEASFRLTYSKHAWQGVIGLTYVIINRFTITGDLCQMLSISLWSCSRWGETWNREIPRSSLPVQPCFMMWIATCTMFTLPTHGVGFD
jgi:hypothetical protein